MGLVPATQAQKGRIQTRCPDCGSVRWVYPSNLTGPKSRARIDSKRRRAERICRRCHARRLLRSERRIAGFYARTSPKHRRLIEQGMRRGDPWAKTELRGLIGASPGGLTRDGQSVAARSLRPGRGFLILRGGRRRPIGRCRLCGLLVEARRYRTSWSGRFWHPPCRVAWLRYSGQWRTQFSSARRRRMESPPPPKAGRSFTDKRWGEVLLAFLRHRADVLGYPGGMSISRSAEELSVSKQALSEQLQRLVTVLPGSWDDVFHEMKPGARRTLQKLFQLPERLWTVQVPKARAELMQWLTAHQMLLEDACRITGLDREYAMGFLGPRAWARRGRTRTVGRAGLRGIYSATL